MANAKPAAPAAEVDKDALIAQMSKDLLERDKIIAAQAKELAELKKGYSGWLVKTPNPTYTGVTAGVKFVGGQAFISDLEPDAEKKARALKADFGYAIARVEDFRNVPAPAEAPINPARAFLEALTG